MKDPPPLWYTETMVNLRIAETPINLYTLKGELTLRLLLTGESFVVLDIAWGRPFYYVG